MIPFFSATVNGMKVVALVDINATHISVSELETTTLHCKLRATWHVQGHEVSSKSSSFYTFKVWGMVW
jgi:hypothetical protein